MSNPRLIYIHTPTRDGKRHDANFESIQGLLDRARAGTSRGFSFAKRFDEGSPNIPRQRNWGAAMALMHGAEGILYVDSDIQFDPEEALDIFERDEEVIGVSHQTRAREWDKPPNMSGRFCLEAGPTSKKPRFDHKHDLLRVAQPTTGFLYVKTSALRKLIAAEDQKKRRLADAIERLAGEHPELSEFVGYVKPAIVQQFIAPIVEAQAWPYLYDFFVHQVNELESHARLDDRLADLNLPDGKIRVMDGEDWDFARKCHMAGVEMWLEPLNTLIHYEGITGMNCTLHRYWTVYDRRWLKDYGAWLAARAGRGCPKAQAAMTSIDAAAARGRTRAA